MKLMIIWGSSRTGRKGGPVVEWVKTNAEKDDRFEVELIDLKELDLPFFDEPVSPFSMAKEGADYTNPKGKAWAERVGKAEAFIFITPEYNRSITGVFKNALDWVGPEWINKPVGIISYGGQSAGMVAAAHLRVIAVELGLVQAANGIHFTRFTAAFDDKGQPVEEKYEGQMAAMLDELARLHQKFSS